MFDSLKTRLQYDQYEKIIYDDDLKARYAQTGLYGDKLKGKYVVVTGAAGGIGGAVVNRFAGEGASVIAIDLNFDNQEGSASEYLSIDLSSLDSLELSVNDIFEKHDVNIWVNCAGVMFHNDKLCKPEPDKDNWDRLFAVNLKSTEIVAHSMASYMKLHSKKGVLINTGSCLGRSRRFGHTAYAVSKYGVVQLGKEIASLYPDELDVFTVSPGTCVTRMGVGHFGGDIARRNGNNKRLLLPEEIAAVVAFCASYHSYMVSGQELFATGGEAL